MGIALVNFMSPGAVFELYIPSDLAYGSEGSPDGSVPPDSVIVMTEQLLSIDGSGQQLVDISSAPVGGCPPLPTVQNRGNPAAMAGLLAPLGFALLVAALYWCYMKNQEAEELNEFRARTLAMAGVIPKEPDPPPPEAGVSFSPPGQPATYMQSVLNSAA
jgi:hypothetical protein